MLLDEIRYVYDETKRSDDARQTNIPSRHCFSESVADFEATKQYLEWYIEAFNSFFVRLLSIGQRNTTTDREQYLLAGWTINRLATDVIAMSTIDVPYIRKWQFFGFLDGVAALKNEFQGKKHSEDASTAKDLLSLTFFRNQLEPILTQIPDGPIRQEIMAHTGTVYDTIANMRLEDPRVRKNTTSRTHQAGGGFDRG
jgi:hypothetical protein